MIIVDTNIILRYLLNDDEKLSSEAINILENNEIFIPTEIIVEVCYVLKKVYNIEKEKIFEVIKSLISMENINFENEKTIELAFKTYSENNLDIVDCLIYAYCKNENYDVKTFDKKLNSLLKNYKNLRYFNS